MAHADVDDIAALAVDPDQVAPEVRAHVASCDECQALEDALTVTAGGLRRAGSDEPLVAPPPALRARILAALDSDDDHPASGDDHPASGDDGSAPATTVVPIERARARRRGTPLWMSGIAAGVALAAGVGVGRLTADPAQPAGPDDPGSVVAAAGLTEVEGTGERGEVEAVAHDDVVTLRVSARELGGEDDIHEVWLINVDDTLGMFSVGFLASGDEGEFEVPRTLIDQGYVIVDISVEPDDGDPTHSGVSVARGELV